ncbi:MAG: hypothetical protein MUF43_13685 [Flavobacterium sp.]|jgi:hypothetical protein|nr:hypothetical protein [Flavobacterium sp.]
MENLKEFLNTNKSNWQDGELETLSNFREISKKDTGNWYCGWNFTLDHFIENIDNLIQSEPIKKYNEYFGLVEEFEKKHNLYKTLN